jgi:hypothetical protein
MTTFHFPLKREDFAPPSALAGLGSRALLVGAAGAAAMIAGLFLARAEFFQAYLVAWLLWYTVASGCLGFLLLQHLSGGAWGIAARRVLEAGARTLPLVGLAAVPLFLGLKEIFVWADPAKMHGNHLLEHKAPYLNAPFFIGRTVFTIVVFSLLAWSLSAKSRRQDENGDPAIKQSMHRTSGLGLLFWIIANTFMGFDWIMSLDPVWFSSLFGGIFVAGQALAAMTFVILMNNWLRQRDPMGAVLDRRLFHDYGKLLFAFVMFWTYLSISQFIIMWQGNLPEEVLWWKERLHGGWGYVAAGILVFHFFFPFLILLSRDVKERSKTLAKIAAFVLFMRFVDLVWHARPTWHGESLSIHWLYFAAPVALGGLWVFSFARELAKHPLLPVNDPNLEDALAHD